MVNVSSVEGHLPGCFLLPPKYCFFLNYSLLFKIVISLLITSFPEGKIFLLILTFVQVFSLYAQENWIIVFVGIDVHFRFDIVRQNE